ncbi:hypothetical protein BDA96_07G025200 [Sorghum bicolor]|uniref:Uncharacterized protein n=2 Tax=Sorghum bicolor TaxID=4558 RepID=A0A921U8J6_SORBI|nr:hypothetical protein BDA96_07G025200 [Sorghum bicolor]OQU79815.1 hypothetical protein SORBI_3007G024000 [Sorghum bicolor]
MIAVTMQERMGTVVVMLILGCFVVLSQSQHTINPVESDRIQPCECQRRPLCRDNMCFCCRENQCYNEVNECHAHCCRGPETAPAPSPAPAPAIINKSF